MGARATRGSALVWSLLTMLIDSNVIIYSALPQHRALRAFLRRSVPQVSAISYVEVLGFHLITQTEKAGFETFFREAQILDVTSTVIDEAVRLRQQRKMALGDSLMAATALVHSLPLATHNTKHFTWIPDLDVIDPLEEQA